MERKMVERRTVLKGGAAAVGMLGSVASASMAAGVQQGSADTPPSSVPDQIRAAFQRFRETIPTNFDHEYVEKAVGPFFLMRYGRLAKHSTRFLRTGILCCPSRMITT
jgi:hypothetical protein